MKRKTSCHRPVVGVLACRKCVEPLWSHTVAEKYLYALSHTAGVMPISVPSLADLLDLELLFERVDGILLPGSVSNIEPHHYHEAPVAGSDIRDQYRDSMSLGLITAAVRYRLPLLGICRGYQEINVALGGSLHQRVVEVPGMLDHREPKEGSLELKFDFAHDVSLRPGGMLHNLLGQEQIRVNSLHEQGVKRLGAGLLVEASAPDGLVEAFRHEDPDSWILGVQWHPEWQTQKSAFYSAIFRAFGDACRDSCRRRRA